MFAAKVSLEVPETMPIEEWQFEFCANEYNQFKFYICSNFFAGEKKRRSLIWLCEDVTCVVCIPNMSTFHAFRSLCVSLRLLARLYTAIHQSPAQTHLHASQAP